MRITKVVLPLLAAALLFSSVPLQAFAAEASNPIPADIIQPRAMHLTKSVAFSDLTVTVTYTVVSNRISGIQRTVCTATAAGVSNMSAVVHIQESGARAQVVATYYKSGVGTRTVTGYIYP